MYRGSIVTQNKGHQVPALFADTMVKTFVDTWGSAVVENGNLFVVQSDCALTVEDFDTAQQSVVNDGAVYYFGQASVPLDKDTMQPYSVLYNEQDYPVLAVFLEGEFPGFAKPESAKSAEFFVVNEYIAPKMWDLYQRPDINKDIGKLMAKLTSDPIIKRELTNIIGGRGVIYMLAANGQVFMVEKNSGTVKFPWGTATQALDYTENGATKVEAEKPKLNLKDRLAKAKANGGEQPKPTPANPETPVMPEPEEPVEIPDDSGQKDGKQPDKLPSSDDAIPAASVPPEILTDKKLGLEVRDGVVVKYYQSPAGAKNQIKENYRINTGECPVDYKKKPKIKVSNAFIRQLIDKAMTQLAEKQKEAAIENGSATPIKPAAVTPVPEVKGDGLTLKERLALKKQKTIDAAQESNVKAKDTMAKHLGAPVLDAEQIKKAHDWLKLEGVVKAIDISSNTVAKPETMTSLEEKLPSFSEYMGMDSIQRMFHVPYTELVKLDSETLACMFRNAATWAVKNAKDGALKTFPKDTKTTQSGVPSLKPQRQAL